MTAPSEGIHLPAAFIGEVVGFGRRVYVDWRQSLRTLHAADLLWLAKSIAGRDSAVV
jgi:hypothetical protein